ncbi:hypothetical protein Emag_007200 [Eimeria magna]
MSVSEGQHPHPATSPQGSALLQQGGPGAASECGASDAFWQRTPDLRRPGRSRRLRKPPEASQWTAPQSSALPCNSKPRGAPVTRPPGSRKISRAEQPPSELRQLQQLAKGASLEKSLSSLLIEEAFLKTSSSSSKAKPLLTTGDSAAAFPENKAVRPPVLTLSNSARHPVTLEAAGEAAVPAFLWSTWGALQKPKSDEPSSRQSQEEPEPHGDELSLSEDSSASSFSSEQKESLVSNGGGVIPKSSDSKGWGQGDSAQEDRVSRTKGPPNLLPFRVPPWQRPLIGCGKQRLAAASLEATGGSPPNVAIVATGTGMLSRRCSAGDLQGVQSGGLQARGGIRREASWPHPPPQQRGLLQPPAAAAAVAEGEARQPFGALRNFGHAKRALPCWNLINTHSISSAATRAAREAAAVAAAAAADAAAAVARRTHSPEAKAIAENAAAAAARGLAPPEAAVESSPFSQQRGDPQRAVLIKQIVAAPAAAAKRPAASRASANPSSLPPDKKVPVAPDFQTGATAGGAAADAEGLDSDSKTVREPEDSKPGLRSPPTVEAPAKEDSEAAGAITTAAGAAEADGPEAARASAESADPLKEKAASPTKAATTETANEAESARAAEAAAASQGSLAVKADQASGSLPAENSSSQPSCDEGVPFPSPPQDICLTSGSSSARRRIEQVLKQPLLRVPRKPWKLFEVQRPLRLKVVTLGPSGSGKSCLVRRFCERRFVGAPSSPEGGEGSTVGGKKRLSLAEGGQQPGSARTIALDFGVRDVLLESGEKVRLHFIDLSGAPEFSDVEDGGPLKGADVVLGVFNAKEPQALQPTLDRLLKARQQTGSAALLALVAAKASRSTAPTAEAAAAAAAAAGVLFYEASAEAAEGVDELFLETAAKAAAKIRSRCAPLSARLAEAPLALPAHIGGAPNRTRHARDSGKTTANGGGACTQPHDAANLLLHAAATVSFVALERLRLEQGHAHGSQSGSPIGYRDSRVTSLAAVAAAAAAAGPAAAESIIAAATQRQQPVHLALGRWGVFLVGCLVLLQQQQQQQQQQEQRCVKAQPNPSPRRAHAPARGGSVLHPAYGEPRPPLAKCQLLRRSSLHHRNWASKSTAEQQQRQQRQQQRLRLVLQVTLRYSCIA